MILKYVLVFLVGGLFCTIAQVIIDKTKITPARTLVIYVCSGVFLSAIGVYAPLVNFAGAGATIPLTGFGHTIAEGVRNSVDEKGFKRTSKEEILSFQDKLKKLGVNVTIRKEFGSDIDAACGQLAGKS